MGVYQCANAFARAVFTRILGWRSGAAQVYTAIIGAAGAAWSAVWAGASSA
jgi:hypothetical protein